MADLIQFPAIIEGFSTENCPNFENAWACSACEQGCWDALCGLSTDESACYAHFMLVHGDK